jgi:hypothetical protein
MLFLLTVTYILLVLFLVAGTDLISAIDPSIKYREFINNVSPRNIRSRSIVLFPGTTNESWVIADYLYLSSVGILYLIIFITLSFWSIKFIVEYSSNMDEDKITCQRKIEFLRKNQTKLLLGPLIGIPLLHLLGIIHYYIYSSFQVIPTENAFFMYNGYSFLAGPAGLFIILSGLGLIYLSFLILKGFYWLFVKENRTIEVVVPNIDV